MRKEAYSVVKFFLPLLLLLAPPLRALDFWPQGGFAGFGPELNGHTRSGLSAGGAAVLGVDLQTSYAAGLKTALFDNGDTLSSTETMFFFRWYLPWLRLPKAAGIFADGPFVQAEAGGVLYLERGYHENLEAFPSFAGGLSAGWRFNFGKHWYAEPALRAGYPHVWGFSLTAGIRYKGSGASSAPAEEEASQEAAQKAAQAETETIDGAEFTLEEGGNMRLTGLMLVFPSYSDDLSGENNAEVLARVAALMSKNRAYRLVIEGHANPTTPETGRAGEQYALANLSRQRAVKTQDALALLGVSYFRMDIAAAGAGGSMAPWDDYANNWKNRRVEFILVKESGGGR